jgi:hypothetical protein
VRGGGLELGSERRNEPMAKRKKKATKKKATKKKARKK